METVKVSSTQKPSESNLIMLVDDDRNITDVLKIGLEDLGFIVDTFNDPVIALSEFKSRKYEAVILDVRMPGLNGFDLCRKMKAMDGDARYCFLTAFEIERKEFDKMFPEIGVDLVIHKPVSIFDLADRLHGILKERKKDPLSTPGISSRDFSS